MFELAAALCPLCTSKLGCSTTRPVVGTTSSEERIIVL